MNLIFLGPPGAGKGTIAARVKEHYEIPHISTGDLFRAHIQNQTDLGKQVKAILDSGELVPDELTIEMVRQRLQEGDTEKGFILDGFPRTIPQAEALSDIARIDAVLNFELSKASIIKRLSGRRIAKQSGRVYHVHYNPPKVEGKCDETGETLIQREDDKAEAIENRLAVYQRQTAPLIDHYSKKGALISIDAEPSADKVFSQVKQKIDTLE
ncbi:MAG: adenylate kinase [Spirochaetota bacterium]